MKKSGMLGCLSCISVPRYTHTLTCQLPYPFDWNSLVDLSLLLDVLPLHLLGPVSGAEKPDFVLQRLLQGVQDPGSARRWRAHAGREVLPAHACLVTGGVPPHCGDLAGYQAAHVLTASRRWRVRAGRAVLPAHTCF